MKLTTNKSHFTQKKLPKICIIFFLRYNDTVIKAKTNHLLGLKKDAVFTKISNHYISGFAQYSNILGIDVSIPTIESRFELEYFQDTSKFQSKFLGFDNIFVGIRFQLLSFYKNEIFGEIIIRKTLFGKKKKSDHCGGYILALKAM